MLSEDERSEDFPEQNQSGALTKRTAKRVDRVRKYLTYAIGEIILVVIGILIALQINNWNEYKKGRIFGKELSEEIRANRMYT